MNEEKCADTLRQHKDKVQCVAWHPQEQAILLSAGFDQKLHVVDVRQSSKTGKRKDIHKNKNVNTLLKRTNISFYNVSVNFIFVIFGRFY